MTPGRTNLGRTNRHETLRLAVLSGTSDATIDFEALCGLLQYLGFEVRIRRSHHVFVHPRVPEHVVLPRHGKTVKRSYVCDVRRLLLRHSHLSPP